MKLSNIFAAGAIVIGSLVAVPAYAQQSAADVASVREACLSGDCELAMRAYIASLKARGLTPQQQLAEIASVAAELGNTVATGAYTQSVTGTRTAQSVLSGIRSAISTARQEAASIESSSGVTPTTTTALADLETAVEQEATAAGGTADDGPAAPDAGTAGSPG